MLVAIAAVAIATGCRQDRENLGSVSDETARKPRMETLVIPEGTGVIASLDTRLTTETNRSGDSFSAVTTQPIVVDGRVAIPAGARIQGVLQDVRASGRVKGRAQMTLRYQGIVDAQGNSSSISALPLTLQAASSTHDDVEKIAAGGVLGAIVGGIAGGKKGAAIGAGAGAGAGTVLMLATKGDEVVIEPGQKLRIQLTSPASVQVLAQR
jgi:hypothetical protein